MVRLTLILAVLLLSAVLATAQSRYIVLLVAGAAAAFAFLRSPMLGLAAQIVAGPLVPFSLGTGTQTSLNVTVLLTALLLGLWMADMALRRDFRLLRSRPMWPLVGLAVATMLSFLAGQLPWQVFARTASLRTQFGGIAVFLLSIGAFLVVAHQVPDERWLARLTWLYLAIGALYVVGRIVPGLGMLSGLFQQGSLGSPFWVWVVALSLSQALLNRHLHVVWRLALLALCAAMLYLAWYQGRAWASGWLPAFVAVAGVLWAGAPALASVASAAGTIAVGLNWSKIVLAVMVGDQEFSLLTRTEAWRILAQIIRLNPVLGLGPANYYWYTQLYSILGYYVQFNSHNNYMDIIAQTGLLGLACFLWFAWEVGWLGWRLRDRVPQGFARAYVCGAFGGLLGTLAAAMLGDWVLPFVYNIGLAGLRASMPGWLFLGGLLVCQRIAANRCPGGQVVSVHGG